MSDEEFDKLIERETDLFNEWLDKNDNLLEKPIKEILGDAFFSGYEIAREELLNGAGNTQSRC